MIERFIEYCTKNRFLIIVLWLLISGWGLYATYNLPIDAIPDISDVQVIILTDWPGQAPEVVESQVTYPLTTTMLAVPKAKVVRGFSSFGFSMVYIIFEDGTDIYWARSRVLEYLSFIRGKLPEGVNPALGPDATGVGWVFEYVLDDPTGKHDLSQLRSLQDWYLRYQLQALEGVAEVASVGGFVKQYQVMVDPNTLAAYGIPLSQVRNAIKMSNQDEGGRVIERAETEYIVVGRGYIKTPADVENIVVGTDGEGTPILVKDIGQVRLGPEIRRGVAEANGTGEVVGAIVVMRFGENARAVIERVKARLEELKPSLPPGVRISIGYDRSTLIQKTIDTLKEALIEEVIIIALVCAVFLLHMRSALVALVSLPLGVLVSFILQYQFNITANILSLSGIALAMGDMTDAAVVMVENAHKRLEKAAPEEDRESLVLAAAKEVGPSLFFSLLVIVVSFLPIFALTGESGKLFKPLAYTKTFAMLGASLLAITLTPILMVYLIRGKIPSEAKNPLNRGLMNLYRPVLGLILRFPITAILLATLILAATVFPALQLGSEFMPPLDEGDLLYMPTTMPGISITEAKTVLQQTDRILRTFPEVEYVFGKVGRAETATDPAPLSMIETIMRLKDRKDWRPGYDTQRLIREMDAAIKFPGVVNAFVFPIRTRIDMLSTGIKTPVGLKFIGPDLKVLNRLSEEAEPILKDVPGTVSVFGERVTGGYYVDFLIDRKEAARYGLTVGDIQEVIATALGGRNITQTVEGLERYPVNLRYFQDYRLDLPALRRILIPTPTGAQIPMEQVAKIRVYQGPPEIKSEDARLSAWMFVDIRDVDVGSYVKKAKEAIQAKLKLPMGYSIIWSGQFEYMEEARKKLQVVIPVTLVLIVLLVYLNTGSAKETGIILFTLPFAFVGAVWGLYLLKYNLSVAVLVGFIALGGLAAETGAIMLLFLNLSYEGATKTGKTMTKDDLRNSVRDGAVLRLRPLLMTALANMFGLLPIMWSTGVGAEVAKRIAAPMVVGVVTAILLVLLVYPAIYFLWKWHAEVKT
ncbi:MAG: CusA/CzcA family heavy metal efflux RND transporter [Syntrophobacterales bacterium]|jgi:Cu(I)/Ag(I) efflux system membrane protein CusA/SilA|nr:CusA/CzcA family heavy metal efflux RND transporter [Syntrophobacterales bacterium]